MMQKIILIGLAGLIGTLCRYWLSGFVARRYGETFPWGTLVVNVLGCFLAGSLYYLMEERFLVSPTLRTVILIGLLGGFTTFSSFGLQTFTLLREGEFALAALNVTLSNLLGLMMLWAGYSLVKGL
jgi:CrcB protein